MPASSSFYRCTIKSLLTICIPGLVRELFRPRLQITGDRGGSSTAHDRQTTDSQPFRMYSTRGANRRHAASRTSQLPSSKRFRSIAAPDLRTVFNTGLSEFSIQILKHCLVHWSSTYFRIIAPITYKIAQNKNALPCLLPLNHDCPMRNTAVYTHHFHVILFIFI